MQNQKFKTKQEFIQELGISKSTFYRLMKKKKIAGIEAVRDYLS